MSEPEAIDPDADPYRPPTANVEGTGARPVVLASRWRRFGTFVLDQAGIFVLGFIVGLVALLAFGQPALAALQRMPSVVLGTIFLVTYYLFFEGLWGRSPGKLVFGTVVVNEEGMRPRFRQIVGRTLCRLIPFEAFSFFGSRGWHDRIPKTRVVLTHPP